MVNVGDVGVLVVDDHALFRDAVRATVDRTPGFEMVGEAVDGSDVLDAAEATRADLVLMDVHMPVLDGIGATRALLAARPTIIVILCSTYTLDQLPAAAVTSGARAYVNKNDLSPRLLTQLWAEVVAAGPDGGMISG